jgi:RNA polymerase sigma factor (sigma-70 family)
VGVTREALRRRLKRAQEIFARGRAARDRFVYHNLRLVVHQAKRFRHMGVPFLDLIQEGNLGLLRAVEKFDERRGNRFSTYGIWWIQQSCIRAIQGDSRTVRLPSHVFDGVRRYRNACDRFESRYGRPPAAKEIAPALGMEPSDVEVLKRADVPIVPLDVPQVGKEFPLGERLAAPRGRDGPGAVGEAKLRSAVEKLLAGLDQRERLILSWRASASARSRRRPSGSFVKGPPKASRRSWVEGAPGRPLAILRDGSEGQQGDLALEGVDVLHVFGAFGKPQILAPGAAHPQGDSPGQRRVELLQCALSLA